MKKNKRRIIAIILIVLGIVFLVSAVTFWIDTLTSSQPAGLGQDLRDWLTTIVGLGTSIAGWIELFNFNNEKTVSSTEINVNGGSPQIATGDHGRNIQAGTYIEKQIVERPDDAALPDIPHQLPSPLSDFTGHEKEIKRIVPVDSLERLVEIRRKIQSQKRELFLKEMDKMIIIDGGIGRIDRTKDVRQLTKADLLSASELRITEYQSSIPPSMPIDAVHFSVISLPVVLAGTAILLEVWAHSDAQREEVIRRAKEALQTKNLAVRTEGPVAVARGTVLVIKLDIEGLNVDDPQDAILWNGEIGNASFAVHVPKDAVSGNHAGVVSVYVNGLRVSRIHFLIQVGEAMANIQPLPIKEDRIRKAFASYSSQDRIDVLARIQGMHKVLPDLDIFIDVLNLRSGQDWEKELWRVIPDPTNDTFFLFWSENAHKSEWVEKEWRCALETRGLDYIDPVPLVPPDEAPPPEELVSKHFNDWELAFIRAYKPT